MAWTTPPTFVDSNTLTAAQLNILSDNQEYLHGLANVPNPPFKVVASGVDITQDWEIQHRGQYLHYWVHMPTGTHDELYIRYDGTVVYSDLGAQTGPYTWQGSVDLSSSPNPTVGTVYAIQVEFNFTSAGSVEIRQLVERNHS